MKDMYAESFVYFLELLDERLLNICENNEYPKEKIHDEIMSIKKNFMHL